MKFLRTVVIANETPAADGTFTWHLPVNPLSHLNFTIKCLNVTNEATIAEILAMVSNIRIAYRGTAIFDLSAADLYAFNFIYFGKAPIALNQVPDDDGTRALCLIVPFGRKLFSSAECFPESKKGELQLQCTVDIANAGADGLILQVEATEILDARPRSHIKLTTLSHTPAATGDSDVPLAIGNELAGILLWGTTIPATTAWTTTIDQVKLLADNVERAYSLANWESLRGDLIRHCGHEPGHIVAAGGDSIPNHAYMDFSPDGGDDFLIATRNLNALVLRVIAGDTNPLRVLPLEIIRH